MFGKTNKSILTLDGDTMDCPNTLPAVIHGYTNTHVLLTDAGNIKIGNGTLNHNTFINATKAIDAIRTNVVVENADIYIDTSIITHPDSATFGIKHVGSGGAGVGAVYTLTIGDSIPEKVTFKNYGYGSYSKYFTINQIKNNFFNNCAYGVYHETVRDGNTYVLYNQFNGCKKTSIYWYDISISAGYSNINFNNINWGGTDTTYEGIRLENLMNYHSQVTVVYNKIAKIRNGIHMRNMHNVDASSNKIEFTQKIDSIGGERNGILLESSSSNYFAENYIYSTNTPQQNWEKRLRGISAEQSPSNTFRHNDFEKLGTGFRIKGSCKPDYLYCNLFDTCLYSLYYNSSGSLGDQGTPTQPWDNVFQSNIAGWKVDGLGGGHTPSNWYFRGCDTCAGNTYSVVPSNPFIVTPFDYVDVDEYVCDKVEEGGGHGGERAQAMSAIIESDPDTGDFANEKNYMNKFTVFRAISEEDSLMYLGLSSDAVLQDFYAEHSISNIGLFEEIRLFVQNGDAIAAHDENDDIIDTNQIETNSRFINQIYFNAALSDTFSLDSVQRIAVEDIAYQSPMAGGEAVYRARAMLRLDLRDDEDTGLRLAQKGEHLARKSDNKFRVYPVPCRDFFLIKNNDGQAKEIHYSITDASGRLIMMADRKIHEDILLSSVRLMEGIYRLEITTENVSETYKLIIIH